MNKSRREISDKEALDDIAQWFKDNDPTLNGSHPEWVWSLVSIVDDALKDTGRVDLDKDE